jgi:hypothetical protein
VPPRGSTALESSKSPLTIIPAVLENRSQRPWYSIVCLVDAWTYKGLGVGRATEDDVAEGRDGVEL